MNIGTQLIFRLSVSLIFLGRAWQHLFWDAPFRAIFWDETLLRPIIENVLRMDWQSYATSISTDTVIQSLIITHGIVYLIAAVMTWWIRRDRQYWLRYWIYIGGMCLLILAMLQTKEKFYHIAQFFEHSIQFGLPFVFVYSLQKTVSVPRLMNCLKLLIAITFFSHGLYAFGVYPVPGHFIDMTIRIVGISEKTAISFLYVAGMLDFILAILLFVPFVYRYALWYAAVWGLLTALARIVANFYIDFPIQSLHQYLYLVVYRLPHGLVPLLVLVYAQKQYLLSMHTLSTK